MFDPDVRGRYCVLCHNITQDLTNSDPSFSSWKVLASFEHTHPIPFLEHRHYGCEYLTQ
jgi:hypothetical protein